MTKLCKTCKSYQRWVQCPKCGKVLCQNCSLKGQGNYPKMKAQNRCPYCNMVVDWKRLTGNEPILDPLCK